MKSKVSSICFLLACSSLISAFSPVRSSTPPSVTIYRAPPSPGFNSFQFPRNSTSTVSSKSSTKTSSASSTTLHSTTNKSHAPTNSTISSSPIRTKSTNTSTSASSRSTTSTSQSRFHSPANSTLTQGVGKNSPTPSATPVGSLVSGANGREGRWMWMCWFVGAVLLGAGLCA